MIGGSVENYLLEKSRIVDPNKDERNYHFFYQICAGASPEDRKALWITKAQDFVYLRKGGCLEIATTDDKEDFATVNESFKTLGFTIAEVRSVYRVIAGIMYLGNLEFASTTPVTIKNTDCLNKAANLLGLTAKALQEGLCSRNFKASESRKSSYVIQLKPDEAMASRDSLAKAIYSSLFDWLIYRINKKICLQNTSKEPLFIGLLDIFGFESFQLNSLEQLCINFANEARKTRLTFLCLLD